MPDEQSINEEAPTINVVEGQENVSNEQTKVEVTQNKTETVSIEVLQGRNRTWQMRIDMATKQIAMAESEIEKNNALIESIQATL